MQVTKQEMSAMDERSNLVLGRRSGESVRIGDDVVVEVQRVSQGKVSLRFVAPRSVRIVRGELPKAA